MSEEEKSTSLIFYRYWIALFLTIVEIKKQKRMLDRFDKEHPFLYYSKLTYRIVLLIIPQFAVEIATDNAFDCTV